MLGSLRSPTALPNLLESQLRPEDPLPTTIYVRPKPPVVVLPLPPVGPGC